MVPKEFSSLAINFILVFILITLIVSTQIFYPTYLLHNIVECLANVLKLIESRNDFYSSLHDVASDRQERISNPSTDSG